MWHDKNTHTKLNDETNNYKNDLIKKLWEYKTLSARPVQIQDDQYLNRKYTSSLEKGYLNFFPQENCRLQVRNSTEIEVFQTRLQAISKKL